MTEDDNNPFLRGSQIFSIFGQIEEVVAQAMIDEGKAKRIERNTFPSARDCPHLHTDALGRPAKFAVLMPRQRVREFEDRIAELRA